MGIINLYEYILLFSVENKQEYFDSKKIAIFYKNRNVL